MQKYALLLLVVSLHSVGIEVLIALEKNIALVGSSFSTTVTKIANIPVLLQDSSSSACGYHALKNGLYYISYLDGNQNALQKMRDQIVFTDFQRIFVELCNSDQKGKPCNVAQPLDNGSLIRTLTSYEKKISREFPEIQDYFSPTYVTVLADYPQWGLMSKDDLIKFLNIVELLQKSDKYKHVFLLGVDAFNGSGNTHWIALVVYKQDGNYFYRLLDSLGKNRIYDSNVSSFMVLLGQSPQKIRQTIATNIQDFFKKHLQELLNVFKITGNGALGLQQELVRFVQLYSILQGNDSKFPKWVDILQDTISNWCSDFLHDGDEYKKLSSSVKETIKKNKKDIQLLQDFLEEQSFIDRLLDSE